ncbi:hypothetical protein BC941DRAFT_424837 [Chlamydoabsidia padenii]|nr:hypothetical protein BC941DRAFT_424837 [Chlamydoabsidia padenii]
MDASHLDTKPLSPRRSPVPSKSTSTINRQNMDRERELQRLKSLGVVSVLNKTFRSQDNIMPPIPSPSSSTTLGLLPPPNLSSSFSDTTTHGRPSHDTLLKTSTSHVLANQDSDLFQLDNHQTLVDKYRQMQVLLHQTQQDLMTSRTAQLEMEQATQRMLEDGLKQKELESIKVQQLSSLVLKQDMVIQQLGMFQHELAKLKDDKSKYEQQIVALGRELESSQEETRRLAILAEVLAQERQQQQMDASIAQQQQQMDESTGQQQGPSLVSTTPHRNPSTTSITFGEKARHSALFIRSTSLPRRAKSSVLSWPCLPPPSGPPPSSPLPPLPIIDDDQIDPELQHMTQRTYLKHSSLEQLLLQAPSDYTLDDDDDAMEQAYREFTQQLHTSLSIPKEIEQLDLWHHDR